MEVNKDLSKSFVHRSFEERLAEYDNKITTVDFDWGEPLGRNRFDELTNTFDSTSEGDTL